MKKYRSSGKTLYLISPIVELPNCYYIVTILEALSEPNNDCLNSEKKGKPSSVLRKVTQVLVVASLPLNVVSLPLKLRCLKRLLYMHVSQHQLTQAHLRNPPYLLTRIMYIYILTRSAHKFTCPPPNHTPPHAHTYDINTCPLHRHQTEVN